MANLLRLRLRFKNFRPGVVADCWFLLNPGVYRQVSDFVKDIQAKFQIGPTPLRCSTKGFLLPPNEDIAVIRDEDEIIIEEEGIENATIIQDGFGELSKVVQSFNDIHQNFTARAGEEGSRQKRKLEEGNVGNLKSKKRREDASTKGVDAMTVEHVVANMDDSTQFSTKTKTPKKKKKSKITELDDVERASKEKMKIKEKKRKQADDTLNCGKSVIKDVKVVDEKQESTKREKQKKETLNTNGKEALKNSLQRTEIISNEKKNDAKITLNEEIPCTKYQKLKKKLRKKTSDPAIKSKSTKEKDEIEDVKSKSEVINDERPSIDPVITEKIMSKRGKTLMKTKGLLPNPEVKKISEANNKATVSGINPEQRKNAMFDEKSFQIMERKEASSNQTSTPLTSSNSHHPKKAKVSSKKDGSHIYFGSDDDDDDDENSDTVSSVNFQKLEESNLNVNKAKYSDKSAKNKALKDRLVNISRIYVNPTDNRLVNENNNNLDKKSNEDVMPQKEISIKSMQSENTLSPPNAIPPLLSPPNAIPPFVASSSMNESNSQEDTAMNHKKTKLAKDYSAYPSLQGAPRVGDKIAFKILELSLSYTPEVSDYKEGVIQNIDQSTGVAQLLLSEESRKRITGDGDSISRKFELEDDEEDEIQFESIIEMNWKQLVEPKLL
eukprot:Seg817.8 transcript_id=Seg817.8/GoldUCD/mRNA.D3Y31 product=Coilin protein_id=Seg817.8/GoldUCD/D3Y31